MIFDIVSDAEANRQKINPRLLESSAVAAAENATIAAELDGSQSGDIIPVR